MSWDLNYIIEKAANPKTASVGASGLDYSQFTPCSGNSECGTCKHIQSVMDENKDEETGKVIDKESDNIHKQALDFHQNKVPGFAKDNQ